VPPSRPLRYACRQLAKNLFDTVVEGILALQAQVQRRIDATCAAVGGLWMHLVFFSTMQVLAITVALREHTTGILVGSPYHWWWLLQDFFHLGGGIVLLTAAVGLLCIVSHKFGQIPAACVQMLLECGCPPSASRTAARTLPAHVSHAAAREPLEVSLMLACMWVLASYMIVLAQWPSTPLVRDTQIAELSHGG
jgi:hypothetical protein